MSVKRTRAQQRALKDEQVQRFRPNRITAALLVSIGAMPVWAADPNPGSNNITLHDGNFGGSLTGLTTATSITTSGTVTDISTTTVRGNTGFNSFGNFNVGAGNTVNLNVPGSASNLVNLVHDTQVVINGTLNGLKDGKIGGNVIFADPHGMVVGASGVVNVGSLTVTTPSTAQMTELAKEARNGTATTSDKAAADLIAGKYNDSDTGNVSIGGTVNTGGSLNLFGAAAVIANGAKLNAGVDYADAVFRSTVNIGSALGAGVARQDGSIKIVATDKAEISGELAALMADDSGGNVQVKATNSIALKGNAKLLANGKANENSGNVTLEAPSITLSDNARVSTAATGSGTSGNITLTAYSDISLKADANTTLDELTEQLSSQAQPLLAATRGKAEVVIGAGTSLDAGQTSNASKAGDVSVTAFGFDRQMSGYADASGSIKVAGSITGKDISLQALSEARVTGSLLASLFSSDALSDDFAALKEDNGWTDVEAWSNIIDALGDAGSASAQASDLGTLGLDANNWSELGALLPFITVAIANANADVTLASTAVLKASHDIDISAETTRYVDTSTGSIPGLSGKLPFNLGIAYGRISGTTLVDVQSGASLTASHDLGMQSLSDNTLELTATSSNSKKGNGSQASTSGFAFGMAHSDIDTLAQVADGALLNVGNDVTLTALTQQSLSNEVSFKSIGEGALGGPAIALTLFNSTTRAVFDADLDGAHDLNVSAINLIDQQSNSSSVQAGKSDEDYFNNKVVATAKPITDYLGGKIKALFGKDPNPSASAPTETNFRLASALAIGIADHQAEAIIGSNGSAPVIDIDGDLAVQALQRQSDMHNSADSSVNAEVEKDDGSKTSLSVAAVYSQLDQSTRALIGDGSNLTAARIGVGALNQQLLNFDGLDRWSSLDDIYENLKNHATSLPDVPGMLSSSYANAASEGEELSIAGSISVVVNSLDSTAWVGDNVTLKSTSSAGGDWSSTPLSGLAAELDEDGEETDESKDLRELSFDWQAPMAVQANTEVQQLAITGNLWFDLFSNNSDGDAAGAGVNVQVSGNSAVAGIGAGGSITAKKLAVAAEQDELIIGISPSAGKGASVAGNGAVVVSVTDSTVNASIHNSTAVTADQVGISAEHQIGMWSAAGALSSSENTGIGASIAVNVLGTDVQALVGDNRAWRPDVLGTGANNSVKATWSVDEVLLDARSSGQSGAFGVAGAMAKSEEEKEAQDEVASQDGGADGASTSLANSLGDAILQTLQNGLAGIDEGMNAASNEAGEVKDTIVQVPDTLKGYWDTLKGMFTEGGGGGGGSDDGSGNEMSLAIAGSGTINVSGQKTRAHLGDIVLDPRDPTKGSKVSVLSLNQTNQFSGAGGGALTLAGGKKSDFSSAIAGAIAYNHLYNVTESLLDGVTLNNNDLLKVEAASAGDQIAMGLGLAVASGGTTNVAVALSASGAVVDNSTRAAVVDSVVNQRDSAPGSIEVTAYDRSRLLIGGGAFASSKGKGTSAGGSLALGVLTNSLLAEWLGSSASNFASFDLSANSASRVLAGALAVAVSTGQESGAGAGSGFVVVLDNEIKARVDANDGTASSLKGGAVNVDARSVSNLDALDSLFSSAAQTALADTGIDMDGEDTAAGIDGQVQTDDDLTDAEGDAGTTTSHDLYTGSSSGEAVLGIAGTLAATSGKTGVGGALGVVYTGSVYKASVANTAIDLSGDLNITASNDTQVLAAAIGAAGGNSAGISGSGTIVIARGSVDASLDMSGRTLKADDLSVSAVKKGASYSLAGNIAGSSQSASVGGAFSLSDMQQSANATIQNGTYQLTGDASLTAAERSRIITAALSGSVSGSGVAVGGALTYNRIADTTTALLQHANLSARNLAITASQPDLGASIWSIAFNLAAAGGSAGVGAAVAVNLIDAERSARLYDSTVNLTGDATLSSALDGEIWGLGVDVAGGSTAGVGGSIVVNNIDGSDSVTVENSTLSTSGSGKLLTLDASAGNGLTIASLTGSITGGGTAAVGGAISVNRIGADRTALARNSSISGFSQARLLSGVEQTIYAIAVAGGGAGSVAVNGSSTSNILDGEERAAIDGGSFDVGALTVSAAQGERTIWSLAGAISGAGSVAVGVANANNIILAKREAQILDASLTLTGALQLESGGAAHIRSAAVGAGGGGTAAAGASIAVNVIQGEENALLSGSTLSGASAVNVEVIAGDADIKTLSGNVQGAGSGAGGAAVAVSTVEQKRQAKIVDSLLSLSAAAPVVVKAQTRARIDTLAVAGAASGTGSVAFSNTSNNISAVTLASVENSGGSVGKLSLLSSDTSTINALSGGAAAAGNAAVGAATAVNRVESRIESSLSGSKGSGWGLNSLVIDADSAATIRSAAVSGAASGTAAVVGSFATNIIQTQALAHAGGGANVVAQRNIGISASNIDSILSSAGAVGISGNAGVGASATVNLVESQTKAYIDGASTRVSALATDAGDTLTIDSGALLNAPSDDYTYWSAGQFNPAPNLGIGTRQITGLAVQASSVQQVGQLSVTASAALAPLYSAAVAGLVNTSVISGSTDAYIDSAQINQASGAGSTQNVRVGANAHSFSAGYLTSLSFSLGAAALSATLDSTVISRETKAYLHGVTLGSKGTTEVNAGSSQYASSVIASAAGGIVGGAGSAGLILLKGDTQALVDGGSALTVGGLKVAASALQRISPNAVAIAGGAVGAGGTFVMVYNQSTTRAWVGEALDAPLSTANTTVRGSGAAVNIQASNDTRLLLNAAGASGGGSALAGSAAVSVLETVSEAGASQADFGTDAARLGSLDILATDSVRVLSNAGAVSVGGSSVGGSANVLVANSATRALFDRGTLKATGAFNVRAQREGDFQLNTLTGGAGGTALGGSIGLLLLGSGSTSVSAGGETSNPLDELDKGGNGTLSQANALGGADKSGDISHQDYVWNATSGQYELVTVSDSDAKTSVNSGSQSGLGDRLSASSTRKHETVARVSDSSILVGGVGEVSAQDKLQASNLAGNAVIGASAAAGGAFAFTLSNARVTAETLNSTLAAGNGLRVSAAALALNSAPAVSVQSLSGSAGFGIGLGASVGVAVLNNAVNTNLDGTLSSSAGDIVASASDSQALDVDALGVAVGASVGAGLVLGVAAHDSDVGTTVANGATLTAANIGLTSTSNGAVSLQGRGAAGGINAGINAAVLVARDQSSAKIDVGSNTQLLAANLLSLQARVAPSISANSLGVALGGYLAAGASVVDALAKANASLILGSGSTLQALSGVLTSEVSRGSGDTVNVYGLGVSGGVGVSANAVVATARNESSSLLQSDASTRFVGNGAGTWTFLAATDVRQKAEAEGYAAGLLTLGASVAKATASTSTQALVNGRFSGIGTLKVGANAAVDNLASSTSGQGGLVSGAASLATTGDSSTTRAVLYVRGADDSTANRNAQFQAVELTALHQSTFNAFVNSINASLVGASGAHAGNSLSLNTRSELLADSRLETYAYEQRARAEVTKADSSDYNVVSGSGGVVDAAAAQSISEIAMDTRALVGSNAYLHLIGDFRTPQNLLIHAYNSVFARDKVKLDSGGAISIALGKSQIDVSQADASVDIGSGADLMSIGDIILSASGKYDIDARANAKTYGLAGAAQGYSLAAVDADYEVTLGANTTLLGYGDIRLYAGQNANGSSNQATLTARTDLWNNTAFPVVNKPDADATYSRTSNITVSGGSLVNSVGDIYAYADKGYGDLLGKGIAKDLYTEALNALGLSVEISSGKSTNTSNAVVRVDGALNSGYYNKREVHITGLEYWVNGSKKTLAEIASMDIDENSGGQIVIKPVVTTSDDNITYRLVEGTYSQYISSRVEQLNKQLADYGLSSVERTAMQAELNLLQKTLDALFVEMGGAAGEGASLTRDQSIQIFELDPILAKPGNVFVTGDALIGSGKLNAPGDAAITVTNDTSAFLRILGLEVPYREGGQLLFNLASLQNAEQINGANAVGYKTGATFSQVTVSATSPDPVVTVVNSYNPATGVTGQDGLRAPAPDIYIDGRIFNQRGLVTVTASYGSVYANADIRGKTLQISAGRDFVLNSEDAFFHVGGDPATNNNGTSLTAPAAGSGVVAGNNVVISAQYLNINGLIQSGVANWTASITDNSTLNSQIAVGRALYQSGYGAATIQLVATDARTGTLGYSYDFRTENIVLDAVEVAGGYMELTGYVMSTGNGQLSVLDGYSQVGISNTSNYTLGLSGIDLGSGTQGTLRINDVRRDGNGNEYVWSSIYTRDYNTSSGVYEVMRREGYSDNVLAAGNYAVAVGRSTTYDPVSGRSYVWLGGQDRTTTTESTFYKDKFWGAFNVGDGTLYEPPKVHNSDERPIDGAEYMGNDTTSAAGQISKSEETYKTGDDPHTSTETWTTCKVKFIWCQVKRSWLKTTVVEGEKVINRYSVRADNPINISFIGSDVGAINVDSSGNVVLLGSLFNQNGSTSIKTSGSLTQASSGVVVQANNLDLQAASGIGSSEQALAVQVGNLLSAKSTSGDIVLRGLNGGLNLSALEALHGNVSLTAQGNITTQNSGVTIKGHAINLVSTHGGIGAAGSLINIDTNTDNGSITATPASLSATAVDGVFLNEVSGDLLVDQVVAGGDVHLKVADGDLVDGNTSLAYDERTLDQLKALWSDMGLTGEAAAEALAQQKDALVKAGQSSYERYWNLRTDKSTGVVGVYDLDQVQLSTAQIAQLKSQDWSDAQIATEQTRLNADYEALHAQFGDATYDPQYVYQLSAEDTAQLNKTAAWSEDQLQYSMSSALLSRGTDTQSKIEEMNVQGRNVTLDAYRVGKVLAEDLYIDLGVGIANLSKEQLAALAGAELDDVYFDDPSDKTKLRIVQRDDVNVAATGNLTVTASKDVYIGGSRDFNIYNVSGDTVRIKTDGNIESANGSNVVVRGHDVVLESSNGSIGGNGSLHIDVSGDLTARARLLNLTTAGNLSIQRLTGLDSLTVNVGGSLLASGQNGEHLLGGAIAVNAGGNLGSADNRIQLNSETDSIALDVDGSAWIGGLQGVAVQPGSLDIAAATVGGVLDIAQTSNLTQSGDWNLGSLVLNVGNSWSSDVGTAVVARDGISAVVGNAANLGALSVTGNAGSLDISAKSIVGNAADVRWQSADLLKLNATGGSGSTGNIGRSDRHALLQAQRLDIDAAGQLFLDLAAGIASGSLDSVGNQTLNSLGDLSLTRVDSSAGGVQLRGSGLVRIDTLGADNTLDLAGAALVLGSAESRNGNLLVDLTGSLDADSLKAHGDLTLDASAAEIESAEVGGATRMTLVGDLDLGSLDGGGLWNLTAANAQIGSAEVDGKVDMDLSGDLLGLTQLTAAQGWDLDAVNANVTDAVVTGNVVQTLSGSLTLGSLDGEAGWTLSALDADIDSADLVGNVVQTVRGVLDMDDLVAGGSWTLNGATSTIGNADVTGAVSMTQTGLLTLGTLAGGSTWTLDGTSADIGTATVASSTALTLTGDLQLDKLVALDTDLVLGSGSAIGELDVSGDLDLKVGGLLDLTRADVSGDAWLTHTGLAGTALHYGALIVGDQLSVSGAGAWSGDSAVVSNSATYDVGSTDLGSLVSRNGQLSLKAAGLFAADTLDSEKASVDLASGSADLGNVHAYTTLDVETNGDLTILSGRSGGDLTLSTLAGSLGNIRFGVYADPDAEDVLVPAHLKSDESLYVLADGNVFGGNAEANKQVRIIGRNLYFGRAQSLEEDIFLQSTGPLELNEGDISGLLVEAARDVGILANGDLSMPTVKFGGNYSLKAGRDLTVGVGRDLDVSGYAEAGRDLTFVIAGKVDLQGVIAGRDASITSGQSINIDESVTAGGNITLIANGGDITVGDGIVSTGLPYEDQVLNGNVLVRASGNVTTPVISAAAGNISVSGHDVTVDDLSSFGSTDMLAGGLIEVSGISRSGGYQNWQAAESIDFGQVLADEDVQLEAGDDVTGELVSASDIAVSGHSLRLDELTSLTDTDLLARGLIEVSGISRSGGYQNWQAAESIDFGQVLADEDVQLEAGDDVTGELISASDIAVSGHSLRLGGLASLTDTDLLAGGLIEVSGISRSGGYQNWQAAESIDFGQVLADEQVQMAAGDDVTGELISASDIDISGHSLRLDELTSLTDIDLLARGLVHIAGTSQSGGNQNWHADESIFFERLLASGQALLDSMLDTQGSLLRADQGATVNAGWRNGVASDADILLGMAEAPTLSLWAGNLIRVADSGIGQSVDLHGQDIELYGRHTGAGQLNLWVEGSGEQLARRFDTRLVAADIVSPRLYAVDSRIETSGSKVELRDAMGVDHLELYSAQAVVIADDTTPTYRKDADVQLYELDKAFQLKQDGLTSTTSGYVLHRKFTHQVLVQNFSMGHAQNPGESMLYQGISAARYGEQNLSSGLTSQRIAGILMAVAPVLPAPSQWTPSWKQLPMDSRMNVDVGAEPRAEEGVAKWEL